MNNDSSKEQTRISKKICMLGSFGVGKTSLVRRFVYDIFKDNYLSTIGVKIEKKEINVSYNHSIMLNLILWDIAHIEKFNNVIKSYFEGSHGAIVVFDLTRPQTFKETDVFLMPYLKINPKAKLLFVGNKIDLVDKNTTNVEQLEQFEKKYKTVSFLTSAKTGDNVEQLFSNMGKLVFETE